MRICMETVNLARRGFEELTLRELSRRCPWSWKALLYNVDTQVELSMTLIQLPSLWPRSQRKRRRGQGLEQRPISVEGGRWQRVVEHARFNLSAEPSS